MSKKIKDLKWENRPLATIQVGPDVSVFWNVYFPIICLSILLLILLGVAPHVK
jgi:hypothetical protein